MSAVLIIQCDPYEHSPVTEISKRYLATAHHNIVYVLYNILFPKTKGPNPYNLSCCNITITNNFHFCLNNNKIDNSSNFTLVFYTLANSHFKVNMPALTIMHYQYQCMQNYSTARCKYSHLQISTC